MIGSDIVNTVKIKCTNKDDGMLVEASARTFTLQMDEPEQMGGTNLAMAPTEVALSAMAGCQAIVVKLFAKAKGISFDDFYIEVEGDHDMAALQGKSDKRTGFQEIRVKMHFKTDEPKEKMEEFVSFVEQTCPVTDTLKNGTVIKNLGVVIE